jgi:hypothetical protein
MVNLTRLDAASNHITDTAPLVHLKNIAWMDFSSNRISSLEAWAAYVPAPGQSVTLVVIDNPLDDISLSQYIPTMEKNGLTVEWQSMEEKMGK